MNNSDLRITEQLTTMNIQLRSLHIKIDEMRKNVRYTTALVQAIAQKQGVIMVDART